MSTDHKKVKILCVDDEPFILSSLSRILRSDYEIILAESGPKALDLLKSNADVAVAIVDQRMPDMSGVELLEKLTQEYPMIIKIVLTGYTDLGALIDSVNKGEIFRYVQKPWDTGILKSAIGSAVKRYNDNAQSVLLRNSLAETQEKLKKVIDELQFLKSVQSKTDGSS